MISVRENRLNKVQHLCDSANIYLRNQQYHRAIGEYLLALELVEEWGTPQMAAALLQCLGSIYRQLELYPRALQFYRRALALLPETDNEIRPVTLQEITHLTQQYGKNQRETAVLLHTEQKLGSLSLCFLR
jgi:tetratricopeptide (TPR) repeat protein